MPSPPRAAGRRISWERVPASVRAAIESYLGARVTAAATQAGGFSPGAAVRLRLADGGRAFVKAVSTELNADSVALYRAEAGAMAGLEIGALAPKLLDTYDDGQWVALVYEDIEGRHPALPWRDGELERVLAAIEDLSTCLARSAWEGARPFSEINASLFGNWARLAAAPPDDLDPWLRRNVDRLAGMEPNWPPLVAGTALLHTDIRSDNVLLTGDAVVFLDWAWTCLGAAWVDLLLFALTVNAEGGADVERIVAAHPLMGGVDPDCIDAVVLGALGYWSGISRTPEPPSLPGVRAYQRAYADATLRWARRRLGR